MACTPSGNSAFHAAVRKAENAYRVALTAAGLTPAQTTAATKRYLEAVITAGVLHEIATPDEMITLSELNRTSRLERRSA
jgi:hypothetical protein